MRKTLALLLATALLYLAPSAPVSVKSQTAVAPGKFQTVANPIPNRYIVVLATTDLSPIAAPAPTPLAATPKSAQPSAFAATASESSSALAMDEAIPADSQVEATATALTSDYGGAFSTTWSVALKGFLLNATQAQAIAMSEDSRVAFITEDGAIAVGTPDGTPIVMTPDPNAGLNPQPQASWGLDRIDQRYLPLDKFYAYLNDGEGVNAYVIDTSILPTHWEFSGRASAIYDFDREGNGVDCNGHGTHVAGIVGASGDTSTGGARGVAPGVTFGAYRVFGCAGSTTDDIMIAAMERALADDMDVLNMSIGAAFQWPQYPTAQASDRLVNRGVTVVASIGNSGANGVYSASAPGVGEKVIGVASFDNSHINALTFRVNPSGQQVPYLPLATTPACTCSQSTLPSLPGIRLRLPVKYTLPPACFRAPRASPPRSQSPSSTPCAWSGRSSSPPSPSSSSS